eukprot:TRINITY_DN19366_c0_g1_i1.p1 TRINITY_DN19366_c0_g1~~TRINITY_DN19366_c0_g1_i1.p1  ORF type:complete len:186 (+),score=28.53 TRINITY_DN19366_c0_g1_i1:156-713(+)
MPHPSYKLLNIKTIPQMPTRSIAFSSYNWMGLLKHLHQMLIADAKIEEGINWSVRVPEQTSIPFSKSPIHNRINKSLSNMMIMRGDGVMMANPTLFANKLLYAPWRYDPLLVCCHPKKFNYDKMSLLLSNSQSVVVPLDIILERGNAMFHTGAFMHHYHKHQVSYDDFMQSFVQLEKVVQDYRNL